MILLDWSQPWFWLRELRGWIRLLRTLLVSLDDDCKEKMEEVMTRWRDRGRNPNNLDTGGTSAGSEGDISLPLGPGEWDEVLGLPLCVVCQNVSLLSGMTFGVFVADYFVLRPTESRVLKKSELGERKSSILCCNF